MQAIEWEKTSAIHTSEEVLIPGMYETSED